jgi:hypothetical protein
MTWLQQDDLKGDIHYGALLIIRLINGNYTLGYWTGTDYFDSTTNQRISRCIIRKVGVPEEEESGQPIKMNAKVFIDLSNPSLNPF